MSNTLTSVPHKLMLLLFNFYNQTLTFIAKLINHFTSSHGSSFLSSIIYMCVCVHTGMYTHTHTHAHYVKIWNLYGWASMFQLLFGHFGDDFSTSSLIA